MTSDAERWAQVARAIIARRAQLWQSGPVDELNDTVRELRLAVAWILDDVRPRLSDELAGLLGSLELDHVKLHVSGWDDARGDRVTVTSCSGAGAGVRHGSDAVIAELQAWVDRFPAAVWETLLGAREVELHAAGMQPGARTIGHP